MKEKNHRERAKNKLMGFWERQGGLKPPGELTTHRDVHQVRIETRLISEMLKPSDVLLDVGCGNGFATAIYAQKCKKVVGVDYSVKMVAAARKAFATKKNLSFWQGDVLSLKDLPGHFTVVLTTRCLINLTSWSDQKKAIMNLHRILPSGGRMIFAEGVRQGRANLNRLRGQLGLAVMPKVWHNIDFDMRKLELFLKKCFYIKRDVRLGAYDVLTRAIYPAWIYPKKPCYGTAFHALAERLYRVAGRNVWEDYSREICLELVKK